MANIKVGIIGGTGMTKMELFEKTEEKEMMTPYGKPSSSLVCGSLQGIDCVILSRHGSNHDIMPTNVNYRANLFALKECGCHIILATTACGSLVEEAKPGDFVIVDQFIDRTTKRENTFYDGKEFSLKGVCHIPCSQPFSEVLRKLLKQSCEQNNVSHHYNGTMVTIEGPRFSSKAESMMFKSWNATVINMTIVPEVVLANELGLPYASIAMVTDYDCWKNDSEAVSVENVMATMRNNRDNALKVLMSAVQLVSQSQQEIKEDINKSTKQAHASVM